MPPTRGTTHDTTTTHSPIRPSDNERKPRVRVVQPFVHMLTMQDMTLESIAEQEARDVFGDSVPWFAVKLMDADELALVHKTTEERKMAPLTVACCYAKVGLLQWMRVEKGCTAHHARACPCLDVAWDHPDILRELREGFGLTTDDLRASDAIGNACSQNKVGSVQYMLSGFGITLDDILAPRQEGLGRAIESGAIDVIRLLLFTPRLGITRAHVRAAGGSGTQADPLAMACFYGHVETLALLHERLGLSIDDWSKRALSYAVHNPVVALWLEETYAATIKQHDIALVPNHPKQAHAHHHHKQERLPSPPHRGAVRDTLATPALARAPATTAPASPPTWGSMSPSTSDANDIWNALSHTSMFSNGGSRQYIETHLGRTLV